jgi:hypothetical protein
VSRTLEGLQKFNVFAEMRMPLSQEDFIGNRSENGEAQFSAVTFVDCWHTIMTASLEWSMQRRVLAVV